LYKHRWLEANVDVLRRALTREGVSHVLAHADECAASVSAHNGRSPSTSAAMLCSGWPTTRAAMNSRGCLRPRRERARHLSGHSNRLTSKLSRQKNSASPPPCR
jgi:antitoxin (DNA-binding transcriptional repressor) of toxin-antitoxin stability system